MKLFHRITVFLFNLVYRVSRWANRRFTVPGKFLLFVLVISAALGVDTRINLTHQIFTLLVSMLLLSLIWAPFFRLKYEARRKLPRFGTVGESLTYRVTLSNLQGHHPNGLEWSEDFSPAKPVAFTASMHDEGMRMNWFDRLVGYPRWSSMMRLASGSLDVQYPLADISTLEPMHFDIRLQPLRRGYLYFSRCSLTRTDPLGLFRGRASRTVPDKVLILPKRYRLPIINLPGSRRYQQGGVSLASEIGESDEFASLRDYRPGDPLRHVHWKSLARTGKPVVKQYQDEYFSRHALILDTFTHDDNDYAFEAAVSVAASFAATIDTNESLLDLLFVGNHPSMITAGRSLGRVDQLLETLACVETCSRHQFSRLTESVMAHSHRVSGCICVLLQWDEPRRKLIQQLTTAGSPCLVLFITDEAEPGSLDLSPMADHPERFHTIHPSRIEQDLAAL